MSEDTVKSRLEARGLSEYVGLFWQHQITLDIAHLITDADLQQMGVTSVGARKRLLLALAKGEGVSPASATDLSQAPLLRPPAPWRGSNSTPGPQPGPQRGDAVRQEAERRCPASNRSVDLIEAPRLFFINWQNFKGRTSQSGYWWAQLWIMVGMGVLGVLDTAFFGYDPEDFWDSGVLSAIGNLILAIPGLSLFVRRLHDVNRSGWWSLIAVTIVGIIPLLYWTIIPGTPGPNKFGPDVEAGVAER